jgi:hypothetical protein
LFVRAVIWFLKSAISRLHPSLPISSFDEAVFAAYGWKSNLSDEEILEKLLALNLERSKVRK